MSGARYISTGMDRLDAFLGGGIQPGKIYHIYGPSSSGKTTLALQIINSELSLGKRVIWIETEKKNFLKRLETMIPVEQFPSKLKNIIVFSPYSFSQQSLLVNRLTNFIGPKINLIVFDTITNLYRSSLLEKKDNIKLNKEINRQMALIKSMCAIKSVSCILLNQVRSDINVEYLKADPVANKIILYWCDFNIEIVNLNNQQKKLNIVSNDEEQRRLSLICEVTSEGFKQKS
mgnify:FL=1